MTLWRTADFSSVYIPSITPQRAAAFALSFDHAMIGYDTSPASASVRASLTGAGMSWSAYRLPVAGSAVAGVNNTATAIHAAPTVPVYFCVDVEPTNGIAVSRAELDQALTAAELATAGTSIRLLLYSAPWVAADYYPGWNLAAERPGWWYWGAWWNKTPDLDLTGELAYGFTQDRVAGHQYDSDQASAIGAVDVSEFAAVGSPFAQDIQNAIDRLNAIANSAQLAVEDLTGLAAVERRE